MDQSPALTTLEKLKINAGLLGLVRQRGALTPGMPMFSFKVAHIASQITVLLRKLGVDLDAKSREVAGFAGDGPDLPAQPRKVTSDHYEFDADRKHGTRKKDNAAAMALLRQIDAGEIAADSLTDEQKSVLAKYSGTGGNLTGADGLKGSAYEYYTPKPIAAGMWDLLGELGFKGGKVLDPCAGTGIFGATAPLNAAVEAVELNETSGRINQLVNGGPGYNAVVSPYEAVASRTDDEIYDAVVSNVPFGGVHDRGSNRKIDPKYQDQPLETYFILRSLEKLRPGGLACFIVPPRVVSAKGEGREQQLRIAASYMAEFLGAYRLPNSVFGTADADTITDVIVFRKFSRVASQKIAELREQNPTALIESNVLWTEFISGHYFTGEGRRFVLGEFVAKDTTKFRDVDRVVSDQSVPNIAKLLRKFPGSRIDWKALDATETQPIEYNEGDCLTLAGQTLEMRNGVWVAIGKTAEDSSYDAFGPLLASPLAAVSGRVTFEQATQYVDYLHRRSLDLDLPVWLRQSATDVMRCDESDRGRMWFALCAGLATVDVMQDHSGEPGFNYLETYPVLSDVLIETAPTAKKAPAAWSRESKAAFTKARIVYDKKTGFEAIWKGEGAADVDLGTRTQNDLANALLYVDGPTVSVEKLQSIMGEGFDVMADEDWCLDGDGRTATKADDYFTGNYAAFLARIDAQIKDATGPLREKLLGQRAQAAERLDKIDPTGLKYNLFTPFATIEEKCEFMRRFMHPAFNVSLNNLGEPYIIYEGPSGSRATTEQNLMSRMASYLSGNAGGSGVRSLTLQGKDVAMSDRDALALMRNYAMRLNTQFDGWVKSNPTIMDRMAKTANDPDKLYFNEVDDNSPLTIPGLKPELTLHGYQNAYTRKQARNFGGINGFDVGLGKAQPLDSKILTPDGWKRMGDMRVGDLVFAVDGTAVAVTGVYPQGEKEIFEVEFSDGARTRCCDEHLWWTNTESDRKIERYNRRLGRTPMQRGHVKALSEIRASLVYQTQKNHQIPMVEPVQFAARELPVRPYLMGVLLGDGGMTHSTTIFTTVDQEVASRVAHLLKDGFGDDVAVVARECRDRAQSYGISRASASMCNPVRAELERFGLAGKGSPAKFIPAEYLLASVEQRIELLRGLMDTDGYVSKDGITVQFCSTSRMLADGVQKLVQSLGGIAWISSKIPTFHYKGEKRDGREAFTVTIRMPASINPFHLARKAALVKPKSKYLPVRYFTDVRSMGRAQAQCISIDHPSRLYVTDDYIVTHNTFTALAATQYVQSIGVKKKTFFVLPNTVMSNWRKEASRAYESMADCLFIGLEVNEKTGDASVVSSNYARDFTRVLENRHRKIFCTMEAFSMLPLKDESVERYEAYLMAVDPSFTPTEKKADAERANSKLSEVTGATGKKSSAFPYFEDLGCDSLVLDEAHAFKNSKDTLEFSGGKFLSVAEASQRGRDMQMKAWWVRGLTAAGDGVMPLTATPITNSPLEIYSMLTLAVGEKKVHDLCLGVQGADQFMDTMCTIEDDEDVGIDGTVKSYKIFTGLQNVNLLRSAIGAVATIKTGKDVKSAGDDLKLPDAPELKTNVILSTEAKSRLNEYKMAYRAAKEKAGMAAKDAQPATPEEHAALDLVQARFGEPVELIAHPFNLIQKMTALIADPELDERATFYTVLASQRDIADGVIAAFNKLGKTEVRARVGPFTDPDAEVGKVTVKDGGGESILVKIKVRAKLIKDGRIAVDTTDYNLQLEFEKLADKAKLELDCTIPPKLAALLANVKAEEANPRSSTGRVKQLIFCDILPLHNKIKRILAKHAGIAAAAIVVVSGQSIKNPEQMQDIQDGFNAEGKDNRYRAVIANEKAEVGINLQKGTQAIHHLTIGWTPDSQHQRNGRGVRQGNTVGYVNVYHYDADGTFDEYKRTLTTKKADWIGAVMDKQGGNEVSVSGGLTSDQYDELIGSMGDSTAVQAIQDRAALKERLQRAESARQRQVISLQTAQSQQKFLKTFETTAEWLAAKIGEAFDLNEQINDMLARPKGKMKAETLVRFESRIAELQAKLAGMLRDLDEASAYKRTVYRGYNGKPEEVSSPISEMIKAGTSDSSYATKTKDRRESLVRMGQNAKDINPESTIAQDFAFEQSQARSMIDESYKEFARLGKLGNGAHSPKIVEAFRDGTGMLLDNQPVVRGMFVRDSKGNLAIVDGSNHYGAPKAVRLGSRNGIAVADALRGGGKLIGFGSADYDAAVIEAAGIDDAQTEVDTRQLDELFSSINPDVAAHRKVETLVKYRANDYVLPAPMFAYTVDSTDIAKASPVLKDIVAAQAELIKRWDEAGYYFYALSTAGIVNDSNADSKERRATALAGRCRALGVRATGEDLSILLWGSANAARRSLPFIKHELKAPAGAADRFTGLATVEEVEAVAKQIIVETLDWLVADPAWTMSEVMPSGSYTVTGAYNGARRNIEDAARLAEIKRMVAAGEANSPQFESYQNSIMQGRGTPGMLEQIRVDERLGDGEAEKLVALADKHAADQAEKQAAADALKATAGTIEASAAGKVGITGQTMTVVRIGGDSKPVKDFIKMAAEQAGGSAKWQREALQWDVTPQAWEILCTKYPEAAKLVTVCPAVE